MNASSPDAEVDRTKLRALIKEYLDDARLMQVASCANNQPWVASVWLAVDDDLNLYFISRHDRRHSREIRGQPKVAGAVVKPPFEGLGQKVQGISFEGKAEEIGLMGMPKAYGIYKKKWPQVTQHAGLNDVLKGLIATRFYKITVTKYVLFDEVRFPSEPRREYVMR